MTTPLLIVIDGHLLCERLEANFTREQLRLVRADEVQG
jgi:hypothetical protein